MPRYMTAFHQPHDLRLATLRILASASGAPDTAQRANAKWKAMLAAYEPPPMEERVREALEAYVARRVEEVGRDDI